MKTTPSRHTIFLTGAAGYVGAMLIDQWSTREDVEKIIALDVIGEREAEEFIRNREKVVWIQANTVDESWKEQVAAAQPDVIVHAAWQIRNFYGDEKKQWQWNVEGSKNIFTFALELSSVTKLIYLSSAAILGAGPEHEIENRLDEDAPLKDEVYLYAREKKVVEEALREKINDSTRKDLQVGIIRPAAITGPRGRFMRIRFGLQSALSGKLKGNIFYTLVSTLTTVAPVTKKWCRQFIHEDDIVDIVTRLAFGELPQQCNIYNATPPGPVVRPKDMGEATGKRLVVLPPWFIRMGFFFARHLSFGKIPTAAGAWRYYSFPTVMDGDKITRELGFKYRCDSKTAFISTKGRYEYAVPEDEQQ